MRMRSIFWTAAAMSGLAWWLSHRGGPLEPISAAKRVRWPWGESEISAAEGGRGRPLVLIHGIYPGASSNQWVRNFSFLARRFKVFAPDLVGFGLSSRPALDYTPLIYEEMIESFLREVVGERAIVVASGQSAAFAIKVAADSPELISHLILDTPTGLSRFSGPAPISQKLMYRLWRLPVIGDLAFMALVSRPAIRSMIATQALAEPDAQLQGLMDKIYRQAHQPGAKWGPAAMLGGRLNTNIRDRYEQLDQPILLVWGDASSYIPIDDVDDFLSSNEGSQLRMFSPCRLMPEYEQPSRFNLVLEDWITSYEKAA